MSDSGNLASNIDSKPMANKIGRNDPCWCGSKKKYKKCHLGRKYQKPINHWEISQELKSAKNTPMCLVPETMKAQCSGRIVKAHTIPKSGSLQHIARDGHVYGFVPTVEKFIKTNGQISLELLGINRASTFAGFCAKHDNEIFSELEKKKFTGSPEQFFLLGYRAIAREFHTKKNSHSLQGFRRTLDSGMKPGTQYHVQSILSQFGEAESRGLKYAAHHKNLYDNILLQRKFDSVRSFRISIKGVPRIMVSGGIYPEFDFHGNLLQDLMNVQSIPHLLNFASFYGDKRGEIIFTWLSESDHMCRQFIESLMQIEEGKLADSVIRFFFEHCENVFVAPDWWDQLEEHKRDSLINHAKSGASSSKERNQNCLQDDGTNYDTWKVLETESRF